MLPARRDVKARRECATSNGRSEAPPADRGDRRIRKLAHAKSGQSPVIQLRPDGGQPQPSHAIRRTADRRDQAAALELPEQAERAVAQHMAVAGEAIGRDDMAGRGAAAVLDAPALRQRVQHALFVFGNVHVGNARQSKERLRRRRAGQRGA